MNTLVTIKVLLIVAASVASQEVEKVRVTVYYEALCPDSIKFFNEQLTPNLDIINKYVQLKHVPYGKAKHDLVGNAWKSECRHGTRECENHQVQACVLMQEEEDSLRNSFISCLMKRGHNNRPYSTEECATRLNLTSDDAVYQGFLACVRDEEYHSKIEEFKRETHSLEPPLKNVPTIVLNGVYKQADQDLSLKDFKKVLCDYIQADAGVAPECVETTTVHSHVPKKIAQSQHKVEVTVYYEALCPDSIKFFNEQLTPNLDIINKYVQLKHVPYGKAKHEMVNGEWTSKCRHTIRECEGHQVQACALLQEGVDTPLRNSFISCLMQKGDRDKVYPTEECATSLNLTSHETIFQAFNTCMADQKYDSKIEEFKRETNSLKPPLKNVPTIVFNGDFKQKDQDEALKDFAKVLCHYIEVNSNAVPECQTHRNAADSHVISTLLLTAVAALIIRNF